MSAKRVTVRAVGHDYVVMVGGSVREVYSNKRDAENEAKVIRKARKKGKKK